MPASTPDVPRQRMSADARRAQIVEAAIPVVVEHGLAATTKQMAAAAGVSEGTIFKHFGDKDALLDAMMRYLFIEGSVESTLLDFDAEGLDLEAFLLELSTRAIAKYSRIFRLAAVLGPRMRDHELSREDEHRWDYALTQWQDALARYPELTIPLAEAAALLRVLLFAAGSGETTWGLAGMQARDVVDFFLRGATGARTESAKPATKSVAKAGETTPASRDAQAAKASTSGAATQAKPANARARPTAAAPKMNGREARE